MSRPPDYVLAIENWHPELTNRLLRSHWSVERRAKREAAMVIGWAAKEKNVPPAQKPRRIECVMSGWPTGRLPDADAFDKVMLDGLKSSFMIVDDSPVWLVGRVNYYFYRSRATGTFIAIWEEPDANVEGTHGRFPEWWNSGWRRQVDENSRKQPLRRWKIGGKTKRQGVRQWRRKRTN